MAEIPEIIHESWHEHLKPLFELSEVVKLKTEILPSCTFYPRRDDIFKVFQMPLSAIKVVIIGQDPYAKAGQATGLSFAVPQHVRTPPSLAIIQRELMNEKLIPFEDEDKDYVFDKTLISWFYQGVFLLNSSLTVEAGKPNSHSPYWREFIEGVINIVAREVQPIWLLWGSNAKSLAWEVFKYHEEGRVTGSVNNRTMSCSHPATEAYPNGQKGFYGCNHFKKVNNLLIENGRKAINW